MKRSLAAASVLALLGLGACSPQTFTMNVETRSPSSSGIDLAGKSVSVVYVNQGQDDEFLRGLSEGFAKVIEDDYFDGKQAVGIYKVDYDPGADYASRDSLRHISADTDGDVVFLISPKYDEMSFSEVYPSALSSPDSAYIVYARQPYTLNLVAYDATASADSVRLFQGKSTARQPVFAKKVETVEDLAAKAWPQMSEQGSAAGKKAAQKFTSTWKNEQFTMFYYDSPEAWTTGGQAAYEFKWAKAIKAWLTLVDTNDLQKRSCAEYNIAVGCYMLGDYDLATKWLNQSDADAKTVLSDGLRKRILSRQKALSK